MGIEDYEAKEKLPAKMKKDVKSRLEEKIYSILLDRYSDASGKQDISINEAYIEFYKIGLGEVAKLLHVHPNTLRRWSDKGIIRSYRFGLSGERRFKFADVLKLKKGDQSASLESDKPNSNMLTITEVADILHASENTVRHWADGDSLTCYRIGPRGDRRFDPKDVKDFAEKMGYPKDDIEHLQNYINRTKK